MHGKDFDMPVRKVVAGSVLAAGVAVGLFGAGTAAAAPGISFDPGTNGTGKIGFGDQSDKGASALATTDNTALAISISRPAQAVALGQGNNVVAIDGVAMTDKKTSNNRVTAVLGGVAVTDKSNHNNVLTVGGVTAVGGDSNNTPS